MGVKTVLVVEDDPDVSFLLEHDLRGAGFETVVVASGEAALEEIVSCHPDAVILDLNLPGIDGWETLGRLRARPSVRDVPVIVLSARDGATERQRALADHVSSFFAKPWQTAILLRDLRHALA
jgi:two-component system, OmpR family, phosphate regulon response regulator PhoB